MPGEPTTPRHWARVEIPPPVIDGDGKVRRQLPPVRCPHGHQIHANARTFEGRGHITCTYSMGHGRPRCNAVMITSTGLRSDDGKLYRIDIHATYDELLLIEAHSMGLAAMFAYLGVPWPPDLPYPHDRT